MDRSDLQSLLEELKISFDYEKFRDSKKPVQTCDPFWVDTFHRLYVEDGKKERDDLLFYVKLDSKQDLETVEVLRRDSKSLPKRTDRGVLWEQTLYLNILLHEFEYHVTSATLTVKPKSDSVDEVMTKVVQQVYPSPIERRMDSKGKVAQVAFPNIVFCIDNFEDLFSDIYTAKRGQKVAVQLLATNDKVRLEKLVFLGAIDHVILMDTVDEKEQVSLSTKLKKQLSLRSKSSKIYDAQSSYHFIQMTGPKQKGFAEMAVIKRDSSYLEQPGIFTTSADSPFHVSDSHSGMSTSNSNTLPPVTEQTSSPTGEQNVPPTDSLTVSTPGGTGQGGTIQGGSYSPKLRQAFIGQSSSAKHFLERDREVSPVSRGSCSSQTGLLRSSSASRDVEEGEDMRSCDHVDDNSDELFDHVTKSQGAVDREEEGGVVFKAGPGSSTNNAAHQPLKTKVKSRESMKNLFLSFGRSSKKRKEEEDGDLMFAYLTYVQLPWYVVMEDILNSTKPKAL